MRKLLVLVAVVGCGGDGEPSTDALCNPTTGAWTQWQLAYASCAPETVRNDTITAQYLSNVCQGWLEPVLASGTVTFEDPMISACATKVKQTTCTPASRKDWALEVSASCGHLTQGTRKVGEACSSDVQCAGDAYCNNAAVAACGTCAALAAAGASCSGSWECKSGFCGSGKCLANSEAEGAACSYDEQCAKDLTCGNTHTCLRPIPLGQSCAYDNNCDMYTSSCVAGASGNACTELAKVGQACIAWTVSGTQPRCRWFAGEGCINGTCAVVPRVGVGSACGWEVGICMAGTSCAGATCKQIVGEGAACTDDAACGPYAACIDHECRFDDFNTTCEPASQSPLPGT